MLGPTSAGKNVWQRLQGYALPLRNLHGADPIIGGKLIDRPFPTDRLESHFRLKRTTVLPSLCRHRLVLPHGSMSLTYSVVQFLGSIIETSPASDASGVRSTPPQKQTKIVSSTIMRRIRPLIMTLHGRRRQRYPRCKLAVDRSQ